MSDLISRQAARNAVRNLGEDYVARLKMLLLIEELPSTEPELEIIRCADCKWWDRLEEGHTYGDCRACRSGTQTERWDIHIQRQCKYDFYCAAAEPKEEDDDE